MGKTDSQKRARRSYDKKCKRLVVTVYPTEGDIMRKIESVESYGAYIKDLIRADIRRDG